MWANYGHSPGISLAKRANPLQRMPLCRGGEEASVHFRKLDGVEVSVRSYEALGRRTSGIYELRDAATQLGVAFRVGVEGFLGQVDADGVEAARHPCPGINRNPVLPFRRRIAITAAGLVAFGRTGEVQELRATAGRDATQRLRELRHRFRTTVSRVGQLERAALWAVQDLVHVLGERR